MLGKMTSFVMALALAVLLSACSSLDFKSGTNVTDDAYRSFREGVTRKAQVTDKLGEPQKVRSEDGNTVYVYSFDTVTALPFMPNTNTTVVLTFNSHGVLIKKNRTQGESTSAPPFASK